MIQQIKSILTGSLFNIKTKTSCTYDYGTN